MNAIVSQGLCTQELSIAQLQSKSEFLHDKNVNSIMFLSLEIQDFMHSLSRMGKCEYITKDLMLVADLHCYFEYFCEISKAWGR